MITKEMIEERLATLTSERDQLINNVNAYNGAIQDAQYWIEKLNGQVSKEDQSV